MTATAAGGGDEIVRLIDIRKTYITGELQVPVLKGINATVTRGEFVGFIGARLFSLLVELVFMFVMVTLLKWNDFVAKLIVQVIVVILNYVFSKLLIFKNK